ncbi:TetR/AcrR family transcriptional regulator [Haliscomenobacter sp.]|uniref:TetR/AcrR family transcriptional regulator n=1 Tax=Haliscomenobacter sp. TaxID=2717303 RepID=UPI0035941893
MPTIKTSKEEVLQKSMLLIWQKGYHYTSIGDLASALGMHKSHFYYYFKDKEDLMKEVLSYMLEQFTQMLKRIVENTELDTSGKLQKLAGKMARFYDFNGYSNGCLMANTALECYFQKTKTQTEKEYSTANTAIESVGKEYAFLPIVRKFFSTFIEYLTQIYSEKYPAEEAAQMAVQAVQEFEGALLLTRLFADENYLKQALERIASR